MRLSRPQTTVFVIAIASLSSATLASPDRAPATEISDPSFGRIAVSTMPMDPAFQVRSATYTPSGKVLVSYAESAADDPRDLKLAVFDDDGRNMHPLFKQRLPLREKDNGIRFMVFPDNRRVFLGDFILECPGALETCAAPKLYPVDYPAEVAQGEHVARRWSEMTVAPDNRHVAWTTLLSNFSAIVFLGELSRQGDRYAIVNTRIISTLDPFVKDPAHADGVLPQPLRGGEVKQFIEGGAAISLVGAIGRDTPDSVVQHLGDGRLEGITDTPGYTETTIFSPDERLGMTMTTRFSPRTDPAVLGLVPRPYPASLNMGLSMFAYTYSVTGVRKDRPGNIGPALIDIAASKSRSNYSGLNLSREEDWVFRSPMSWHPGGKKAMWIEGRRSDGAERIRIVSLPDYRPGPTVQAGAVPTSIDYALTDMSRVAPYARSSQDIDVKVYGRTAGYIKYRKTLSGLTTKTYVGYSDDGKSIYDGEERLEADPRGRSVYTAKVALVGPHPGKMDLKITFGPLGGKRPAGILFGKDAAGLPMSHGYAEYDGRRSTVASLQP